MEPRLIVAYSLIVVLVVSLTGAFLWATRDRRAEGRAYRRHERLRRLAKAQKSRTHAD
ncbi:hypothetical protein [Sphingomonas parva]|uniref:hypothetical protein n=1 Tax=Sphingomonas parva TaxID=2555898 RepID=UPI001431F814|nr:hypothetical protein [Sphingomonas parva]